MAKYISDYAIRAIQENGSLFRAVAEALDVKPQSLTTMLSKRRKQRPRRFLEYDCIMTISEITGKEPGLLIERENVVTAMQ